MVFTLIIFLPLSLCLSSQWYTLYLCFPVVHHRQLTYSKPLFFGCFYAGTYLALILNFTRQWYCLHHCFPVAHLNTIFQIFFSDTFLYSRSRCQPPGTGSPSGYWLPSASRSTSRRILPPDGRTTKRETSAAEGCR